MNGLPRLPNGWPHDTASLLLAKPLFQKLPIQMIDTVAVIRAAPRTLSDTAYRSSRTRL
jgi:hypothetical protein